MVVIPDHHIGWIKPVIESRVQVIKRRLMKKHEDNWYDYDDDQIIDKCCDKDKEFLRLTQFLSFLDHGKDS